MTAPSAAPQPTDIFARVTRWAGDLDHPFYDDERQRWVWYEASAIGFQIAMLASFFAAGIAVLGSGVSIGWALFMMMPVMIAALFATGHVSRHGADYAPSLWDLRRSRGVVALSGPLFFVVAAIIDGMRDDTLTGIGIAVALLFGGAVGVGAARRQKKLSDQKLAALDDDE